jgi:hypothetical protein
MNAWELWLQAHRAALIMCDRGQKTTGHVVKRNKDRNTTGIWKKGKKNI